MRRERGGHINSMAILGIVNLFALGCSTGPALTADQVRGKKIYESLCNKCHKLISPRAHSDQEWNLASDKYGAVLRLQSGEIALLKSYLNRANDADFQ